MNLFIICGLKMTTTPFTQGLNTSCLFSLVAEDLAYTT